MLRDITRAPAEWRGGGVRGGQDGRGAGGDRTGGEGGREERKGVEKENRESRQRIEPSTRRGPKFHYPECTGDGISTKKSTKKLSNCHLAVISALTYSGYKTINKSLILHHYYSQHLRTLFHLKHHWPKS